MQLHRAKQWKFSKSLCCYGTERRHLLSVHSGGNRAWWDLNQCPYDARYDDHWASITASDGDCGSRPWSGNASMAATGIERRIIGCVLLGVFVSDGDTTEILHGDNRADVHVHRSDRWNVLRILNCCDKCSWWQLTSSDSVGNPCGSTSRTRIRRRHTDHLDFHHGDVEYRRDWCFKPRNQFHRDVNARIPHLCGN